MTTDTETTMYVEIQGTFVASYDLATGEVTGMTFTPFGFDGESATAMNTVDRSDDIDVNDTEGPFWDAMRVALGTTGDTPVPIQWTE
jgi:hypothetical protein